MHFSHGYYPDIESIKVLAMTLLRIDTSARIEGSHSRSLGDQIEKQWRTTNKNETIIRRDLATNPVAHISQTTIEAFFTPLESLTPELQEATACSDKLINELQSADILLLTVPIYNFSVPSSLKAWIDHITRIGKTFSYDGENFEGLVKVQKAVVVCSYGAEGYIDGGALSSANFLQPYLAFLLSFLGIEQVEFIQIEATTSTDETIAINTEKAQQKIDMLKL